MTRMYKLSATVILLLFSQADGALAGLPPVQPPKPAQTPKPQPFYYKLFTPAPPPPPPVSNWTASDYEAILKQKSTGFYFATESKPVQAQLALETYPWSGRRAYGLASGGFAGTVGLDWNQDLYGKAKRGQLIFQRTTGAVHRWISNVTHLGMIYNDSIGTVLEAQVDGGVQERNFSLYWREQSMWALKPIKDMHPSQMDYVATEAYRKWLNTPYFPTISKNTPLIDAARVWLDKEDLSSMSCSKLVYQAYKQIANVNLDSNRLSTSEWSWRDLRDIPRYSAQGHLALTVTPDEIFYSENVGGEIAKKAVSDWIHTF